jgi:protease-4
MYPQPPPGQGPLDPRGAFSPPPAPNAAQGHPSAAVGGPGYPAPPPMMPPMPPPPNFMPPMYMMPPPPPRRGGFLRSIFTFFLVSLLGISIAMNIFLLAGSVFSGGSTLRQSEVVHGDSTQKIAVIPVVGLIDDDQRQRLDTFLRTAEEDKHVKAIVLKIDSPGGPVGPADEMYHRIQQFRTKKPGTLIVVSQAGVAASGGYYVSCAADYIFAQPSTITGSIGVYMPNYNVSKLMDKWGIEDSTIVASGATYKTAGSMFRPASAADAPYLQALIDRTFDQFKEVVRTGRSYTNDELNKVANGKIFTADDAVMLKLIDKIGYEDDACTYAATKLGLSSPTIVRYQAPAGLFELFSSKSNLGTRAATSNANITINGVQVDAKGLADLMTPRPMYLWHGQ